MFVFGACARKKATAQNNGVTNAQLDAAFESGNLTLVKSEFPAMHAENFEITDELCTMMGFENQNAFFTELESLLAEEDQPQWYSLSPAGNSGILEYVCYYEGKYHIIYPSSTRGVEDEYGNLEEIFAWIYGYGFSRYLGKEGVVYSSDGRYAAITNYTNTIEKNLLHYDPIIIDLSTGEMILTATYGDKLMKENSGFPTTAAFSSNGRYFYYMFIGNTTEYRTALYRYDLQQDTTELCYSGSNYNYCPHLSETIGGDFLIICDTNNKYEAQGITQISYENGTWTGKDFMFDLISEYCYTNCLLYSSNSGYAVVPMRFSTLSQTCFFSAFNLTIIFSV